MWQRAEPRLLPKRLPHEGSRNRDTACGTHRRVGNPTAQTCDRFSDQRGADLWPYRRGNRTIQPDLHTANQGLTTAADIKGMRIKRHEIGAPRPDVRREIGRGNGRERPSIGTVGCRHQGIAPWRPNSPKRSIDLQILIEFVSLRVHPLLLCPRPSWGRHPQTFTQEKSRSVSAPSLTHRPRYGRLAKRRHRPSE